MLRYGVCRVEIYFESHPNHHSISRGRTGAADVLRSIIVLSRNPSSNLLPLDFSTQNRSRSRSTRLQRARGLYQRSAHQSGLVLQCTLSLIEGKMPLEWHELGVLKTADLLTADLGV